MNEIIIYQTQDHTMHLEVQFEQETVWLTQKQMSELFDKGRSTITGHLKNIFEEGELEEKAVCRESRHTAQDGKSYKTQHYNLDVIISVGYRVKSKRGTQFRIWATQRLKEHLVQGYTINQKRLGELQQTVQLIQNAVTSGTNLSEAKGLLDIITHYTQSFVLLNQYDSNSIKAKQLDPNITYEIQYEEAKTAITELKKQLMAQKEATELFGNEKDNSFAGTLQNIVQTFDGDYLYPSIEEQAAHLLYFTIKNHPFSDGNKRIGSFLFVWFLEKNKHRFKKSGEVKINDNGLTALALLIAQSDPKEKELMTQLTMQLINNR